MSSGGSVAGTAGRRLASPANVLTPSNEVELQVVLNDGPLVWLGDRKVVDALDWILVQPQVRHIPPPRNMGAVVKDIQGVL